MFLVSLLHEIMLTGTDEPSTQPSFLEEPFSDPLPKGDVTRDDSQRRFLAQHTALQCWNNVVTTRNNVATMLQRCVALKIVVANCLVQHYLKTYSI